MTKLLITCHWKWKYEAETNVFAKAIMQSNRGSLTLIIRITVPVNHAVYGKSCNQLIEWIRCLSTFTFPALLLGQQCHLFQWVPEVSGLYCILILYLIHQPFFIVHKSPMVHNWDMIRVVVDSLKWLCYINSTKCLNLNLSEPCFIENL